MTEMTNTFIVFFVFRLTCKLEAFINLLSDGNEILELARTGVSGLSRGSDYVLFL